MRVTLTCLLTLLLVPALALAQPHKDNPWVPVKRAIKKIERVEKALQKKKLNPRKVKRLRLELKEARLMLTEFMVAAGNIPMNANMNVNVNLQSNEPTPEPVAEAPEPMHDPMNPGAFANLVRSIKQQGFADEKLTVLSSAVTKNFFNVAQVKQLLKLFSFPDDKLKALRALKSRIVDPNNNFEIYSSFVHSSDKEEAKEILEN